MTNDPILFLSKKKRLISEAEKIAIIEVISQPIVLSAKVKNYYARHNYVKKKLCRRWQRAQAKAEKEVNKANILEQIEAFNDYIRFAKMINRLTEKRYRKAWQSI